MEERPKYRDGKYKETGKSQLAAATVKDPSRLDTGSCGTTMVDC